MDKLIHLSLIQKNIRCLQGFRRLREYLSSQSVEAADLRIYLKSEEPFFFKEFCERKEVLKRESDEIARLQSAGVHFTFMGDSLYPASFSGMPGAPIFLSFIGHAAWLWGGAIAVVGSRDTTQTSHLWMEENFAEFLRHEKPVVISGGARGIDQMAHRLAIRNNCSTVAVLPSGLGRIYPQMFESWQKAIIEGGGCLLSEYAYDEKMQKHFFHDRNRLIAGLGAVTLLVEAKRRSGSLLTAQKTLQLGKSVLVVPGHPCENSHLGNLDLLSDGATPIRDAEDLRMYYRSELNMSPRVGPMASEYEL
jgi:DNA processing protein